MSGKHNSRSDGNAMLNKMKRKKNGRSNASKLNDGTMNQVNSKKDSDVKIQSQILGDCCANSKKLGTNCYRKLFQAGDYNQNVDVNAILAYIKAERELKQGFSSQQYDDWLQSQVAESIVSDSMVSDKRKPGNMVRSFGYLCLVPNPFKRTNFGKQTMIDVCVNAYRVIKGISKYDWELVIRRFKETNSTRDINLRCKRFTDWDVGLELNYNQAEEILLRNIVDVDDKGKASLATTVGKLS